MQYRSMEINLRAYSQDNADSWNCQRDNFLSEELVSKVEKYFLNSVKLQVGPSSLPVLGWTYNNNI